MEVGSSSNIVVVIPSEPSGRRDQPFSLSLLLTGAAIVVLFIDEDDEERSLEISC